MKTPIGKIRPSAIPTIVTAALTSALVTAFALDGSAAPVTNLGIKKIEITQAVQCLDTGKGYTTCPDNAMELDSQRAAAIRVYIQHDGACSSASLPFETVVKAATVKIAWAVSHNPIGTPDTGDLLYTEEKPFDVPCTTDLSTLRDDEKGSATFIIPAEKLASLADKREFIWIEAEIVPPQGTVDTNPADNKLSTQAGGKNAQGEVIPGGFVPRTYPLTVSWTLVQYKPLKSQKFDPYTGPELACDAAHLAQCVIAGYAATTMKQLYPGRIQYYMSPSYLVYGSWDPETNTLAGLPDIRDDDSAWLLELLERMKKTEALWLGVEAPRVLMGWVPPGAHKDADYIGIAGIVAEGEVCDDGPEILAHEAGHVVNISHPWEPGTCWPFDTASGSFEQSDIREAGFRISTGKPIRADSSDFMEQGVPNGSSGISPFHWGVLGTEAAGTWIGGDIKYSTYWAKANSNCAIGTLGAQSAQSSSLFALPANAPLAAPTPQPALLVSGRELADGTAIVSPFYVVASAGPYLEPDPEGEYCLDLYAGGAILTSTCFNPEYAQPDPAGQRVGTFVFQVPFPVGVQAAVVRKGATELARKTASATLPDLVVTSPAAGSQFDAEMEVAWTSSKPETFSMVLYSVDAGMTYHPLAFDLQGTDFRIPVDTRLLPGGDTAKVRIITTDGLNTVAADSPIFKVAKKAPFVAIEAPVDGARINARNDIVLAGRAVDLEEGVLSDGALVWTENGTVVGTGPEVVLQSGTLAPGPHTIKLTGTDQTGAATTVQVTFTIYEQLYIDIKPFSWPNAIQSRNEGLIPVAVLSSASFSAPAEVDGFSLKFGKTGSEASLFQCSGRPQDANGDGFPDLVCMFDTRRAGFDCATSEGILSGQTKAGTPIGARDFVRIVPCGK
jgi:hypothetical protein